MILLTSPTHTLHAPPYEFEQGRVIACRERPERVEALRRGLLARGGWEERGAPPATDADLAEVHDPRLVAFVRRAAESRRAGEYLYPEAFAGPGAPAPLAAEGEAGRWARDVYSPIGAGTYAAAAAAAGLALEGARLLLAGERRVMALCRPPGHHAGPDFFGGYCYFNHAALAARRLSRAGRVALLDLDLHHGNGTQAVFDADPAVAFASLHADPADEYPYFSGYAGERGASGQALNLPLPRGTDGAAYLGALAPALEHLRRFDARFLVVSLGFDGWRGDPLSPWQLRAADFAAAGRLIAGLGLPALFVLEGGYAPRALPNLAGKFMEGYNRGDVRAGP